MENGSNDGFKNEFYKLKKYVKDVDTLAESLGLSGFNFNVLKSLFGINKSRHNGTTPERDLNKMLHYSMRSNIEFRRKKDETYSEADIVFLMYTKLDKKEKEKFNNLY